MLLYLRFMKIYPKTPKANPGHFYFGNYGEIDLGFSYVHEEKIGPFQDPLHSHQKGTEYYWTIQGEGLLEVDGNLGSLTPNQLVAVEPGEKHRIHSVIQAPFQVLVICTVKEKGDKIEERFSKMDVF